MKDETAVLPIKKFVELNPKTYSFLVDDFIDHKNTKCVNQNFFAKISHHQYKDFLLN